ncbi:MAG: VanW family protein, partial [Clostridia bacterium]|nr:VanW family protein [Clostridia bacterium]
MKVNTTAEFLRVHKTAVIVGAAVLAVILATVGAIAAILPSEGRIAGGIVMDGIDIGGMTVDEAKTVLGGSDYYNGTFELCCGSESVTVNAADIGLGIDVEKSVERAYEIGHSDGFVKKLCDSTRLLASQSMLAPVPTVDTAALDGIIYDMGVRINGEMRKAACEDISDTEVIIRPSSAGQERNVEAVRTDVLNSLEESGARGRIEIELKASYPEKLTAEEVYALVRRDAVNAEYTIEGKELYITDEVLGREADKAEISSKLQVLNGGSEITLTVTKTSPEVTAEGLKNGLFGTELASYSSKYSTSAANRSFNVARAADSVNGTILLPNEVFSYNAAIGNPSLANGYKVASVYENGRQTEGVGGGVCQVSSTLYSAVLYANLEIVERRSHSLTVAYVPKGQDATVSYDVL